MVFKSLQGIRAVLVYEDVQAGVFKSEGSTYRHEVVTVLLDDGSEWRCRFEVSTKVPPVTAARAARSLKNQLAKRRTIGPWKPIRSPQPHAVEYA